MGICNKFTNFFIKLILVNFLIFIEPVSEEELKLLREDSDFEAEEAQ